MAASQQKQPLVISFYALASQPPPVYISGAFSDWDPVELDLIDLGHQHLFQKLFLVVPNNYEYRIRIGSHQWVYDENANQTLGEDGYTSNIICVVSPDQEALESSSNSRSWETVIPIPPPLPSSGLARIPSKSDPGNTEQPANATAGVADKPFPGGFFESDNQDHCRKSHQSSPEALAPGLPEPASSVLSGGEIQSLKSHENGDGRKAIPKSPGSTCTTAETSPSTASTSHPDETTPLLPVLPGTNGHRAAPRSSQHSPRTTCWTTVKGKVGFWWTGSSAWVTSLWTRTTKWLESMWTLFLVWLALTCTRWFARRRNSSLG